MHTILSLFVNVYVTSVIKLLFDSH